MSADLSVGSELPSLRSERRTVHLGREAVVCAALDSRYQTHRTPTARPSSTPPKTVRKYMHQYNAAQRPIGAEWISALAVTCSDKWSNLPRWRCGRPLQ
jgi:hypothetical protein